MGGSEWNVFLSTDSFIQVANKTNKAKNFISTRIIPEQEESFWISLNRPDDSVWLVWDGSIINNDLTGVWNAKTTFDWLSNDLIPYVIASNQFKSSKNKMFPIKKISIELLKKKVNILNYIHTNYYEPEVEINDVVNVNKLRDLIKEFISVLGSSSVTVYMGKLEVQNLLKSILLCVEKSEIDKEKIESISRSLGRHDISEKKELLDFIEYQINKAEDQTMNYYMIQRRLICILDALCDLPDYSLNLNNFINLQSYLSPLYEQLSNIKVINRWKIKN